MQKKLPAKTKFSLENIGKMVPDLKTRVRKSVVNKMVQEGILEYWSSGSTTYVGLTEKYQN